VASDSARCVMLVFRLDVDCEGAAFRDPANDEPAAGPELRRLLQELSEAPVGAFLPGESGRVVDVYGNSCGSWEYGDRGEAAEISELLLGNGWEMVVELVRAARNVVNPGSESSVLLPGKLQLERALEPFSEVKL